MREMVRHGYGRGCSNSLESQHSVVEAGSIKEF